MPSDQRRRRGIVRGGDRQEAIGTGVPRRANGRRSPGCAELLRAGAEKGRVRGRHSAGRAVDPDEPAVPVPTRSSAFARRRRHARHDLPDRGPGSGIASLVLLVGDAARRRPAEGRLDRCAADLGWHGEAGAPHAGRHAIVGAVDALRLAVAAAAGPRQDSSRLSALSAVRRHARGRDGPGNRALLRQHRSGRSQRARPADGRLQLRERAAGDSLSNPKRQRQRVPTRVAAG